MKTLLPLVLTVAFLASSCASAPPQASTSVISSPQPSAEPAAARAPDWTGKSVYSEGGKLFFVVSGPASKDLRPALLQEMKVHFDISSLTNDAAQVKAAQNYLETLSRTSPEAKWTQKDQVWWKVSVGQGDWDGARQRFTKRPAAPQTDPSLAGERQADAFLAKHQYVEAVDAYVSAAAAAMSADPALPARYSALVAKASGVIAQFRLTSATPAQTTQVGHAFEQPFKVNLSFGDGPSALPVAGAPLRFTYPVKIDGELGQTGQTLVTDGQGEASLTLPAPNFATQNNVVVLVDVSSWQSVLTAAAPATAVSLESVSAHSQLQLPITVTSTAKLVPLAVALVDFDVRGRVQRPQVTTSALIGALREGGFQASGVLVNPSLFKGSSDRVILTAWKYQGRTTGRAVFGAVSVTSLTASGSKFQAEVSGTLKVADLQTNEILYKKESSAVATGAERGTATQAAYRQWAAQAALDLAAELP